MNICIQNKAEGKTALYAEKELSKFIKKYSNADLTTDAELIFQLEIDEDLKSHC